MSRERLRDFFIEDDAARTRSLLWCLVSGTVLGAVAYFAFGANEIVSGCVTLLATICTLTFFAMRYATSPHPAQSLAQESAVLGRRQAVKLSLASILETATAGLVATIFGNVESAIAYANSATLAVLSDREMSPVRLVLAKQTIAANLQRTPTRVKDQTALSSAYAQLSVAENYNRAAQGSVPRPIASGGVTAPAQEMRGPARWIGGPGATLIYSGPWNVAMFLIGYDLIFESLIFDAGVRSHAQFLPQLVRLANPCNVVFKGCTIRNFRQPIDGINWLDVTFEECDLSTMLLGTLLVNVTFRDCSISAPFTPLGEQLQGKIHNGYASGLTLSSEAIRLMSGSWVPD